MRTILALAFIALLAGASAHKSKAPLEESKLVQSLKGLFQLASKDEFDDVAEILAHVREEIEGTLAGVRENYEAEQEWNEEVDAAYEDALNTINQWTEEIEVEISEAEEVAAELQENIDAAVAAIAEAQASQDQEAARRAEAHNAFATKIDQLNALIEGAEDALRLLQEIDNEDLSGSFLEINHKKIKTNFVQMHKALKGMKIPTTLTPMLEMLLEVSAEGINHDLIATIEDLLTQFEEIASAEVDAAVRDDNNDDEYSRATLENLQNTIDSQSSAAEQSQAELDNVNAEIEYGNEWLEWLAEDYEAISEYYEEYQAYWEDRSNNYKALIRRLERDIEALEAAENFVDRDD